VDSRTVGIGYDSKVAKEAEASSKMMKKCIQRVVSDAKKEIYRH
jgi:hypothetical protein